MCAGAILQARVDTVVWGAPNKLLGADGSWIRYAVNMHVLLIIIGLQGELEYLWFIVLLNLYLFHDRIGLFLYLYLPLYHLW